MSQKQPHLRVLASFTEDCTRKSDYRKFSLPQLRKQFRTNSLVSAVVSFH